MIRKIQFVAVISEVALEPLLNFFNSSKIKFSIYLLYNVLFYFLQKRIFFLVNVYADYRLNYHYEKT
jgi:hypothetical protein